MTPERQIQIERICQAALECKGDARAAFLADACAGDDALRQDVASLLAHEQSAERFIETPALDVAAQALAAMPSLDRHIDGYELLSFIGAGGMGEVYRARDRELGREVAIKVLPEAFASDPKRQARLEREARALAALNHPHIAHVYGLKRARASAGSPGASDLALVMELVEGETLSHLLEKGPLEIDDALNYGAQIADALTAAHARGIIHRDLKPANVMITSAGAKVLDFGLATRSRVMEDDAHVATITVDEPITRFGQILGTVSYMSPEQAEGKPVDARSDIFAFGVVLYETLCGRRPFTGDTSVAVLASVLHATPARPRNIRHEIPEDVERIVVRCLEKKPEARYSSARDLLNELTTRRRATTNTFATRRAAVVGAAAMILIGAAGVGVRTYVQTARTQWVEQQAVPEIRRLLQKDRRLAAMRLFQRAERYSPASRALIALTEGVAARQISITSTPAAAQIYVSDYADAAGDSLDQWQLLGETPLTTGGLPFWGVYRLRAVKHGFAPAERTLSNVGNNVEMALHTEDTAPAGMVWVDAGSSTSPAPPASLPGFWMDRYEVTNRQFKAFVDAGGYAKEEFWKEPFVKNGLKISWRDAIGEFRDATNKPGPASWVLGTYPENTDDMPVSGVSWHEAAAYAEFAHKSLPTVYEWYAAAAIGVNSDILTLSNFGGRGPQRVGANRGMARSGTVDMAGNVKEWSVNAKGDLRYLLGGAWTEETYVFSVADPRAPFSRDRTFGLRGVRRVTPAPEETFKPLTLSPAAQKRDAPVDDQTFRIYLGLHSYDKTDLDARLERRDESSPYWRRETLSVGAAYGNERVIVHLFLPTNTSPPYQTVAFVGGATITQLTRVEALEYPYQFLLRSGRAVVIPAYSGTLERGPSPRGPLPRNQERERALKWSMDLGRSIDYLETRSDIDIEKLGFYGVSIGATHGVRLVAVDDRFKTAVLSSGGLFPPGAPETDTWNFAPRVRVPVLMLNGRDDFIVPFATHQKPLFDALGSKEKVFKQYEGGHANLVTRPDLIGDILDWLDKHLGQVSLQR